MAAMTSSDPRLSENPRHISKDQAHCTSHPSQYTQPSTELLPRAVRAPSLPTHPAGARDIGNRMSSQCTDLGERAHGHSYRYRSRISHREKDQFLARSGFRTPWQNWTETGWPGRPLAKERRSGA